MCTVLEDMPKKRERFSCHQHHKKCAQPSRRCTVGRSRREGGWKRKMRITPTAASGAPSWYKGSQQQPGRRTSISNRERRNMPFAPGDASPLHASPAAALGPASRGTSDKPSRGPRLSTPKPTCRVPRWLSEVNCSLRNCVVVVIVAITVQLEES